LLLSWVRVPQSVFYCVVFRQQLFFLFVILLLVLRFTGSGYPFWYLQTFLACYCVYLSSTLYPISVSIIFVLQHIGEYLSSINYTIHKCVSVIPFEQARSVYNVYICHHCFIIDRYYLSYTGIQSKQY